MYGYAPHRHMLPLTPRGRLFGRRIRILLQKSLGGHDESGSAEGALEPLLLDERLLDRVQLVDVPQALDGQDFLSLRLHAQNDTCRHRFAVHDDGARTAFALVARNPHPVQAEPFSQYVGEGFVALDIEIVCPAVYGQSRHPPAPFSLSSESAKARRVSTAHILRR